MNTIKQAAALMAFLALFNACNSNDSPKKMVDSKPITKKEAIVSKPKYIANRFDFPVGKPDAKQYYNAQPFGENDHLGDDWNGRGGGNTDLGDPIYAIGAGYVKFAENYGGGWGNIVRIIHFLPRGEAYESFYAHCDTILVKEGEWVKRGQQIGTIGNAGGIYYAHLHFEVRADTSLPVGGGYSTYTEGYLDPTEFIQARRKIE